MNESEGLFLALMAGFMAVAVWAIAFTLHSISASLKQIAEALDSKTPPEACCK